MRATDRAEPSLRATVHLIEGVSRFCGAVAAALVFVLMALMVYEVVVRYALSAPTIWGYEVSTSIMGASFLLAIAYALSTDSHVRIDFLHDWLGPRARYGFDLIGYAFVLPLLIWLTFGLWDYFYGAFHSWERSGQSAWNPIIWPFRLILFVGVLAWTLQVAAEVVKAAYALLGRPLQPQPAPRPPTE
jgi:TRAP-type mannitol/chloroaromatic compound transport system permease small subunit